VALLGRRCTINTRCHSVSRHAYCQSFSETQGFPMSALIASQACEPGQYSGSSASSVNSWLEGHPHDPAEYEHNQTASKKRQPRTGKPSSPAKKRKQLAKISVNSMSVPEPRQTRGRAGVGKRAERSQKHHLVSRQGFKSTHSATTLDTKRSPLELRSRNRCISYTQGERQSFSF